MNALWAQTLLASLRASGADCIVASPGSRSTPLLCAADRENIPIHVSIDERCAAFFAVGRAKLTGRPAIVVCTSGTAGAHYYPAVIEAAMSRVPVIVITADRPPELAGCGAPQTIDQTRLFGTYARSYFDLGLPDDTPAAVAGVARKAAQAVAASLGPVPGPVHINVPARKPLEPGPGDTASAAPIARHFGPDNRASAGAIAALASACSKATCGLIVAGPAPVSAVAARAALDELATRSGFPVWCEATSQMRFRGNSLPAHCCDALDHVAGDLPAADVIVELWGTPTSAAYHRYVQAHRGAQRWVVTPHGWRDPHNCAAGIINADVADTALRTASALSGRADASWKSSVLEANRRGLAIAESSADAEDLLTRAAVASVPSGGVIAVGNSKPVRTLDRFVPGREGDAAVWCQRGANGIDGLVSGAAGAASAGDRPVVLIAGDVSFAHDAGGLALARACTAPLAIVVIDNGGGRIFEQLPVSGADAVAHRFEQLWLTPPRLDLAAAAQTYGVAFEAAADPGGVSRAVSRALDGPGCTLIRAEVTG